MKPTVTLLWIALHYRKAAFFRFVVLLLGGSAAALGATNQPGTLDLAFNSTPGITSSIIADIYAVLPQPDGRVVIGGEFSAVNGVARNNIARLMPDGSLDSNFVASITRARGFAQINALALQGDRVLVGGRFDSVNGFARYALIRLLPDGTIDNSFLAQLSFSPEIRVIVLQRDGKILISGSFNSINGVSRSTIARLDADGSVDLGFDAGHAVGGFPYALAIQPDGKILVGGFFSGSDSGTPTNLARLNSNGTLDTTYRPYLSTFGIINSIVIQPDGKALLAGDFEQVNGLTRYGFARLNPDATLDTAFVLGDTPTNLFSAGGRLDAVLLQPNGRILFAGYWTEFEGFYRNAIARFLPNGAVDPSFASVGFDGGRFDAVRLQSDGKLIASGYFTRVGGVPRNKLARLHGDPPPRFTAVNVRPGGSTTLTLVGAPGTSYVIERSSDLIAWQSWTNVAMATGTVTVTDPATDGVVKKFYRARTAP